MPGSVVVGKAANMWSLFRKPEYFKNAAGYSLEPFGWARPGATRVPPTSQGWPGEVAAQGQGWGLQMDILEEAV